MKTATTEVMGAAKELIPSYPSPAVGPKVRHHDAFTGPHRQSRGHFIRFIKTCRSR